MKFLNLDLSHKVDRLKFIILIIGTTVFLSIVFFFTYNKVRSPDFCISCHVMNPEYYTWKASAHSNFKCVDCHVSVNFKKGLKVGAKNLANDSLAVGKNTVSYFTNNYMLPVRMIFSVEDYMCLKCHSETRETSAAGDLIIPHSIHKKKQVDCVECHSGVAHGNIAARREVTNSNLNDWNQIEGKKQVVDQFKRTPMDDCMGCHQRRSGPLDCDACHKTSKKPITHQKKEFIYTHGKEAIIELDACNLCHGYSGYVSEIPRFQEEEGLVSVRLLMPRKERNRREIVDYSRDNKFCVDCHSKKPDSHKAASFENYHGTKSKQNKEGCLTCHSNRREEPNPITSTTCGTCHPSSHSLRDWRVTHPFEVKSKINNSCYSCHAKDACATCHTALK